MIIGTELLNFYTLFPFSSASIKIRIIRKITELTVMHK